MKWNKIKSGDNKVAFKQTSKNIWFCDTLDIYCNSVFDGIAIGEKAIDEINKMLDKKNVLPNETKKSK